MDWVLVGAVVFAAWTVTSLLGYERQRRVEAVADAEKAASAAAAGAPAAGPAAAS